MCRRGHLLYGRQEAEGENTEKDQDKIYLKDMSPLPYFLPYALPPTFYHLSQCHLIMTPARD
jgi:hypothetical protein